MAVGKKDVLTGVSPVETLHGSLTEIRDLETARLIIAGLDACNLPVVLFAPDDSAAFVSQAFRDMMSLPEDIGTFEDMIHHCYEHKTGLVLSAEPDEWLEMARSKRRSAGHRSFEIDLHDGRWFMVNEGYIEGGWLWNVYTDITSLKSNENMLKIARDSARRDADTDALTGIYNRRHGIAELERQLRQCRKTQSRLTVALIDLDHFKTINDTHGHLAGDAVLCHFVESTSWIIRRSDTFARYGGEEFLLIMPGAAASDAEAVMQRIGERIKSSSPEGGDIRYTFSAGIATALEVDDMQSLLKRTDIALYHAKANGRDRIEVAPG